MARLGVITTSYPHAGDRVAGCFVREFCLALRDRGHDVTVVCVRRHDGRAWDAPVDDGFPVHAVSAGRGVFYGAGAPDNLRLGASVDPWRSLRAAQCATSLAVTAHRALAGCDAIASHFVLPCAVIGGRIAHGRPHLAIAHGTDGWLLSRFPVRMQHALLRGVTHLRATFPGLVAVSPGVASSVAPMGITMPSTVRAPDATPRVVVVSRLVPVKRVARAVEAVAALRDAGVDVTLTVLGDGPERASLTALAARRGLDDDTFVGAVDAATRDAWLARAWVLLHTAGEAHGRTEGAPRAVLEAMASGCAVVAHDAGGVGYLVGDAGVVFRDGDEVGALRGVIGDRTQCERLGHRARARVTPWSWETQAIEYERILFGA